MTSIAALVLLFILSWLVISVIEAPHPTLAHADAMQEVVRIFDGYSGPAHLITNHDDALRLIREKTGVTLKQFPVIPGSSLSSWKKEIVLNQTCVCLSYHENSSTDGNILDIKPSIMIFAIPAEGIENSHELDFCNCITLEDKNIFCFTQSNTSMNLITTFKRVDIQNRLKQMEY